jgi:hypothetical protein
MAANRWTLVTVALALAVVPPPAHGQTASVSLMHTVSVTVPPRVKVQVGSATEPHAVSMSAAGGSALAISVSATQSWALSIAPRGGRSLLQWSTDTHSGFSELAQRGATVARGDLSQAAAISTLFLREKQTVGTDGSGEVEAVVLTMVAP